MVLKLNHLIQAHLKWCEPLAYKSGNYGGGAISRVWINMEVANKERKHK